MTRFWPSLVLLLLAAEVSGQAVVNDSSGVEIISSSKPLLSPESWRVPDEPILQIGAVEGAPDEQFTRIWDATRTGTHLLVVEATSREIRVFDRTGTHITTFGGPGGGPEEFGGPPFVSGSLERVVVWDPGHYRLSRYDLDGELLEQTTLVSTLQGLPIVRFPNGLIWTLRSDGALLYAGPEFAPPRPGLQEQQRRLVMIQDSGRVTTDLGTVPAGRSLQVGDRVAMADPFAPIVAVTLGPDPWPVAIADEMAWAIRFFGSDGQLHRLLRAEVPRKAVTEELLDQERAEFPELANSLGVPVGRLEQGLDRIPRPDSLPAIGRLHVDTEGRLWVGRRDRGVRDVSTYDIFDREGSWLTTVRLPEDIGRLHEIGPDYILSTWTDDLDVPYLRVYRIEKQPG